MLLFVQAAAVKNRRRNLRKYGFVPVAIVIPPACSAAIAEKNGRRVINGFVRADTKPKACSAASAEAKNQMRNHQDINVTVWLGSGKSPAAIGILP